MKMTPPLALAAFSAALLAAAPASAQPSDHHPANGKCSEAGMTSANDSMMKMMDATRKAAVMKEMDKARDMMAKKDDKGCSAQMHKVMGMMSDTDKSSGTGMMPGMDKTPGAGMAMDMQMMTPGPDDSVSTKGYKTAMMKRMQDMPMMTFTGDADVDFMTHMRGHHQGAVDMARVVLANGKDAKVRKLANGIVKAQQREIATIDSWLKAHARGKSH